MSLSNIDLMRVSRCLDRYFAVNRASRVTLEVSSRRIAFRRKIRYNEEESEDSKGKKGTRTPLLSAEGELQ